MRNPKSNDSDKGNFILCVRQEDGSLKADLFDSDGALVVYGNRKDAFDDATNEHIIVELLIPRS